MKGMCFIKYIKRLPLIFLIPLIFFSCGTDIAEYAEYYTQTAAVVRLTGLEHYPTDSRGLLSIPSGADFPFEAILRNPENYTLVTDFTLTGEDVKKMTDGEDEAEVKANEITITQSGAKTSLYGTILKDFLALNEFGGDISFIISLEESETQRAFEPYTLTLACNTEPRITGSVVMVYKESDDNETYVLCFNLPPKDDMKTGGVQSDIERISINGTDYNIKTDDTESSGNTFTIGEDGSVTFSDTNLKTALDEGVTLSPVSGIEFKSGDNPVYFFTNEAISTQRKVYTEVIYDKMGLSHSIQVSSTAKKITVVIITDSEDNELKGDEKLRITTEEGAGAKVKVPTTAVFENESGATETENITGATVYYEIYTFTKDDAGNETATLYSSGSATEDTDIILPRYDTTTNKNKVEIKAYAQKDLYADSDTTDITVYVIIYKLDAPKITDSTGNDIVDNSTIYAPDANGADVTIKVPTSATYTDPDDQSTLTEDNITDVTVKYEIYKVADDGTETLLEEGGEGTITQDTTVTLPAGKYKIKAHAEKDLYENSDDIELTFTVVGASGGNLDPNISENVLLSLDKSDCTAGDTITVSAKLDGTELTGTRITYNEISLYYRGDRVASATTSDTLSKGELKIPENYPAGQYRVFVSATYNNRTYSAEFTITIAAKTGTGGSDA